MRIGIIDDHWVFSEGLKLLLKSNEAFNHVETLEPPTNGASYHLPSRIYDLLLVDINMPNINGLELCAKIKKDNPNQKIVIFTARTDVLISKKAKEAGADYFINKSVKKSELIEQLIKIINKPEAIITQPEHKDIYTFSTGVSVRITEREMTFLKLLSKEYTSKQMAEEMELSVHTIIAYRKNLFKKFQVNNMIGLVKFAFELFPNEL